MKSKQINSMIKKLLIILFICLSFSAIAQTADTAQQRIFELDALYDLILKNHPVAKQINLLSEVAKQNIRLARGSFDPVIKGRYETKEINNTTYYDMFAAGIDFTSIIPIHPQIGFEQNKGPFVNQEKFISPQDNFRQLYAGVRIPLGQGFITDERRAALKQAEFFSDMLEAEQISLLNNLLLDAAKDYWSWSLTHQMVLLNEQAVNISQELFRRVKMDFSLGEASVIDTVQSFITYQSRLVALQESLRDKANNQIILSNYLWTEEQDAYYIPENYIPNTPSRVVAIQISMLNYLLELAQNQHPELRIIDANLMRLDVEKKLNSDYLKPRLMLSYNFLNQPINSEGNFSGLSLNNNYNMGLDFSFPVFLRKERSQLELTKVKISQVNFKRYQLEREIINDIQFIYNKLINDAIIIGQQEKMVDAYSRLLKAEIVNLESGESDLFRINIQQEKLIDANLKLIKLSTDYEKLLAELYWAAGIERLNLAPGN
jgi:outer membrane protein TolC